MYFLLLHFFVLVILNECEESLIRVFLRFFDNAAFSRPALHEHCPCYVRPFAIGINFVEPAFARSEIKANLYLACLIVALSNPADFVALLARNRRSPPAGAKGNDKFAFFVVFLGGHIGTAPTYSMTIFAL